jgi:hypothetical protein
MIIDFQILFFILAHHLFIKNLVILFIHLNILFNQYFSLFYIALLIQNFIFFFKLLTILYFILMHLIIIINYQEYDKYFLI